MGAGVGARKLGPKRHQRGQEAGVGAAGHDRSRPQLPRHPLVRAEKRLHAGVVLRDQMQLLAHSNPHVPTSPQGPSQSRNNLVLANARAKAHVKLNAHAPSLRLKNA